MCACRVPLRLFGLVGRAVSGRAGLWLWHSGACDRSARRGTLSHPAAGGGGGGEGAGERQERQQQPLEPLPLLSPVLSSLDCIVAADVTYDPAACVALAQTIKVLLRCAVARNATEGRESPQPLCLIAAQEREPATWAMFCQQWLPFQPASNLATGSNGRTSCPPNLYIVELNASHVAKVWSQLGHGHAEGTLHIVAIGTRGAMDEVQRVTDVNG
jgi:hypothetical protein